MNVRNMGVAALVVGAAALTPAVAAAQVAGTDGATCDETNIQDAIDFALANGLTTVYVDAGTYAETLVIPGDIIITAADPLTPCAGGAPAGTRPVTITPGAGGRVIEITGGNTTLKNITVRDGVAPVGNEVGGNILSTSTGVLRLEDSYVGYGEADTGGGIAVTGCGSLEVASGSKVLGNRAYVAGGGVAVIDDSCLTPSSVTVLGDGVIGTGSANQAPMGGDVYLSGADLNVQDTGRIQGGRSVDFGGCVAAVDGSVIDLSGSAMITSCSATAATSRGGGVSLSGSHLVMSDSSVVTSGQTHGSGGLVSAELASTITMEGDAKLTDGFAANNGGLVYAEGGSAATFTGVELSGGTADLNGGGIYATGATTAVVLQEDTIVHGCTADLDGGAMYLDGVFADLLDLVKIGADPLNVSATGNVANGLGGGIFATGAADIVVSGDTWTEMPEGTPPLGGVRFEGNTAKLAHGGGIALVGESTLIGTHAVIVTNNAGYEGGGIYVEGAALGVSVADLSTSVVNGNYGARGGGVAVVNGGEFHLRANTIGTSCVSSGFGPDRYCAEISGNVARPFAPVAVAQGGGLYVAGLGQAYVNEVAISNNGADEGTAILVRGNVDGVRSLVDLTNVLVETDELVLTPHTVLVTDEARLDSRYTTFGGAALTVFFDQDTAGIVDHAAIAIPTVGAAAGLDGPGLAGNGGAVTGSCSVGDDALLLGGAGASNEALDPLFVTTARGRFRLDQSGAGSPAIDQCLDTTKTIDLDQQGRPGCLANDSGALETGCPEIPPDDGGGWML